LIILSARYYDFEATARVNSVWQDERDGVFKTGVRFLDPEENWLKQITRK